MPGVELGVIKTVTNTVEISKLGEREVYEEVHS